MKIRKIETLLYGGIIGAIGTELVVLGQKCYELYSTQSSIMVTIGDIRLPYYVVIEVIAVLTTPATFKAFKKYLKDKTNTKSLTVKENIKINEDTCNNLSNKNMTSLIVMIIKYLQDSKENNIKTSNVNIDDNNVEGSFIEIIDDEPKALKGKKISKWQEYQIGRKITK